MRGSLKIVFVGLVVMVSQSILAQQQPADTREKLGCTCGHRRQIHKQRRFKDRYP